MSTNVNPDFQTALDAITQDAFVDYITDNTFDQNTMLETIKQKSKVTIIDGGKNLQVPVMVSGNTNVESFTYFDEISIDAQAGFTDATYQKAYYGIPFPVAEQEQEENAGNSKIVDLVGARVDQALSTANDLINQHLYLDGSGNASKNILGLLKMCPSSASASTYAGIAGSTVTKWNSNYTSGAIANTLALLDEAFYAQSDGSDKPDIIVTSPLGMKSYTSYLRAAGGWNPGVGAQRADGSYAMISHLGIEILLDQAHPNYSSTLPIYHLLSSKYLGFYYKTRPFSTGVEAVDQFGKVYKTKITCQLVTSRRNRQGKVAITS